MKTHGELAPRGGIDPADLGIHPGRNRNLIDCEGISPYIRMGKARYES